MRCQTEEGSECFRRELGTRDSSLQTSKQSPQSSPGECTLYSTQSYDIDPRPGVKTANPNSTGGQTTSNNYHSNRFLRVVPSAVPGAVGLAKTAI